MTASKKRAVKGEDTTGQYKDAEGVTHYDGRAIVTAERTEHIRTCDRCRTLYGQTLSGWEHPTKRDR